MQLVLQEGLNSYTLSNDGASDILKVKRDGARRPLLVLDGSGNADTSLTLSQLDNKVETDTVVTLNALQGQEARLSLSQVRCTRCIMYASCACYWWWLANADG